MSGHLPIKGMPGKHHSIWLDTAPETGQPHLPEDAECDVAVIGGGITGLTCAYELSCRGKRVVLVDKDRIATGTTGHTTAKITSAHGLIYNYLVSAFGRELTKIYADANQTALQWMQDLIEENRIDCDFKRTQAYTFADTKEQLKPLEAEMMAAEAVGLPVFFTMDVPLPLDMEGAIVFRGQARFHPVKYAQAMLQLIENKGGWVYEKTMALDAREGSPCEVITDRGRIRAKNIIVATLFPFIKQGNFPARLYPKQSYVSAARVTQKIPEGMFFSIGENSLTLRPYAVDNDTMLIFGGDEHKVGQGGNTVERYKALKTGLEKAFEVASFDYYWVVQDNISIDGVPYIGKTDPQTEHIYVATGFKQWGITHATVAALILADTICGRKNPWTKLFDPSRPEPKTPYSEFCRETGKSISVSAKELAFSDLKTLEKGGAAVSEKEGESVVCYRDENSRLGCLSRTCPHMGCKVNWNNAERTWDCPCHGSRFSHDGDVSYGPANENLPELGEDQ